MTVVDGHVMLGQGRDASLTAEELLATMDRLGIERALVSPAEGYLPVRNREGNELVAAAAASSGGRLLAYAVATPWLGAEALEELRRARDAGAVALKLDSALQGFDLLDGQAEPLVAFAVDSGWPVYVRTGTPPHALPLQLAWLAARFPEGSFLLGKAGATDFSHDGPATLAAAPNVYADSVYVEWPTALAAADPDGSGRARVLLHRRALRRPADRARPRHRGAVRAGGARRDPRRHARAPARPVIGLASGDAVVVHASLRAVGLDADEVIDALLEAVGPHGLVVMPTFTYDNETLRAGHRRAYGDACGGVPSPPGRAALGPSRPTRSRPSAAARPSCSTGTSGRERPASTARSDGSPPRAGYVLLLGVGHTANTTVHVGEFHADAPYLDIPFDPDWPAHGADRFPGCSRAFGTIERPLRERGAIRDGKVGRALAQLVPGATVIEVTVELLRADPTSLLCTDPGCYRCSRARARLG